MKVSQENSKSFLWWIFLVELPLADENSWKLNFILVYEYYIHSYAVISQFLTVGSSGH